MDMRDQEGDAEGETPADARCCQARQLMAGVAVAVATTILLMGLLLHLVVLAPEVDQPSEASAQELMERLQRCHKEQHDLNLMLHAVTQDSRCSLCPGGWLWWRSRCYFFSVGLQENRRWNESAEFCQQHDSSLAVIKDAAEMDFIQGVMRKFPQFPFLWLGLTDVEQEGLWLWGDRRDVQHYMPLTVQWDADHRDCADLRAGGSLFANSCEDYGPWVCKRDS
ncbi:natural killer cells antigen CD94-like [Chelmon rostratus]|uniref:natural killer cells antigen CD94-like n=1 Tax=Chelmon rostratus TaxID=109905 RepID=UPI001BE787CC|nr:natural killer cells antigen CD94-like [Chelmon rostratus]